MFSKTLIYKPNPKDIQLGSKQAKVLKYVYAQMDQVHLDSSYITKELNYYTTKTIHSNKRESQIPCTL